MQVQVRKLNSNGKPLFGRAQRTVRAPTAITTGPKIAGHVNLERSLAPPKH
jgi:hypothetical protein